MNNHIFPTTNLGGQENSQQKWLRTLLVLLSLTLALGVCIWLNYSAANAASERLDKAAPNAITWEFETVIDSKYFYEMTDRSLAREPGSSTRMHYAYGGDHLYYAYFDGSDWFTETVDPADGVGSFASIAVDDDLNPHIAYYDATNGDLKYATKWFGAWWIYTIDTAASIPLTAESISARTALDLLNNEDGFNVARPWLNPEYIEENPLLLLAPSGVIKGVGQYTSIALDSLDQPHISYYQYDLGNLHNNKLKYAWQDGGVWQTMIVRQTGTDYREGKYTSIAIDTLDHPHIVFLDDSHDQVRHAYIADGGRWNYENFPVGVNVGGWNSIAINSDNTCYVSFYDAGGGNLWAGRLLKCHKAPSENADWVLFQVESSGDVGKFTSIYLSEKNQPWISYYDVTDDELKIAKNNGDWNASSWTIQKASDTGGWYTSLTKLSSYPHITYYDDTRALLREAYQGSGFTGWRYRTIDTSYDIGLASNLALDAGNNPFISYLDDVSDDLWLASKSFPNPWITEEITGTDDIGSYTDIEIDSMGYPHVVYYNSERDDLEYAKWDGTEWDFTIVDRTGDVGQYASLALGSADEPYISYYDATRKHLNLAYYQISDSEWYTTAVDSSIAESGKWTSIQVDSTPQPNEKIYIAYYIEGNSAGNPDYCLRLAYRNPSIGPPLWRFYTVDDITDSWVGQYASLDLTSTLEPRIVYTAEHDPGDRYLRYAKGTWSGGIWVFNTETIQAETNYDIGRYASLALDSLNNPHVSYYKYLIDGISDGGDLMYAYKDGTDPWEITPLDTEGDVGLFSSIRINNVNDQPAISYYDRTEGELMYAYGTPWPWSPVLNQFNFLPVILR